MTDLAAKRCVACTADTQRVAPDDVKRMLTSMPGYKADMLVGSISKVYEFANFYETMAFVNALAYIAHAEDHHPELAVSYNRCAVTFSTHAIGGLSENDFICAAKIEALVQP
jgi:4a-hydroxytetrahydrobiopterin dehydratase